MSPKPANEPEAFIIYTPGDSKAHMVGAHRNPQGAWMFSKWTLIPVAQLDPFLKEVMRVGMKVLDARILMEMKAPNMGNTAPVVVAGRGVPTDVAMEAADELHKSFLKRATEQVNIPTSIIGSVVPADVSGFKPPRGVAFQLEAIESLAASFHVDPEKIGSLIKFEMLAGTSFDDALDTVRESLTRGFKP